MYRAPWPIYFIVTQLLLCTSCGTAIATILAEKIQQGSLDTRAEQENISYPNLQSSISFAPYSLVTNNESVEKNNNTHSLSEETNLSSSFSTAETIIEYTKKYEPIKNTSRKFKRSAFWIKGTEMLSSDPWPSNNPVGVHYSQIFSESRDFRGAYYAKYSEHEDGQYYHELQTSYAYSTQIHDNGFSYDEIGSSVANDIAQGTVIYNTQVVPLDTSTLLIEIPNSNEQTSSNYTTMDIISTSHTPIVIVPLTSFPDSKTTENKFPDSRDEQDVYHDENKILENTIKPTPSLGRNEEDLEPQKNASLSEETMSRSYLNSELTPSVRVADKDTETKTESFTHVTGNVLDTEDKAGKTPDFKPPSLSSSVSLVKVETDSTSNHLEIEPSPTISASGTVFPTQSSHAVAIESYTNNEIPKETSETAFLDIPGKENSTSPLVVTSPSKSKTALVGDNLLHTTSCFMDCASFHRWMLIISFSFTEDEFCGGARLFAEYLEMMLQPKVNVTGYKIVFANRRLCKHIPYYKEPENDSDLLVSIYVISEDKQCDRTLTRELTKNLRHGQYNASSRKCNFCPKIKSFYEDDVQQPSSELVQTRSGIIAGVSVSIVASICFVMLCILLIVLKQRSAKCSLQEPQDSQRRSSCPGRGSLDAYSLVSLSSVHRKRRSRLSLRSFLNQAFEDPDSPNRPLSFNNLTNVLGSKNILEEEFKKISMIMPSPDTVPLGAEGKNRFANVIPVPETRIKLMTVKPNNQVAEYINANSVKGYGGKGYAYVACQAPLPDTVEDFWRMVWEQQSKMILMVTQLQENGVQRCAPYFPENTVDCHRLYGDFQVTLQNKDVREHFTVSSLRLYEMEKNLFRDVVHLWYRTWPPHSVPEDPSSLLCFMMESRKYSQKNAGPVVVHCSPGTGRTGTVMAIDWCMQEFDESRVVDVQRCVYHLRQDRAGAVQTHQQYVLIHEVVHEYALKLGTQSQRPSLKSLMSFKINH